jgi:hypothetical protein
VAQAKRTFDARVGRNHDCPSGDCRAGPVMRIRLSAAAFVLASACTTVPQVQEPARHAQVAELNHIFATLDPLTADAIRNSDFLRHFANVEVRTTTGTRATWTGRYLYGRRTYLEFFGPEDFSINDRPASVGTWGIALSGDDAGFNDALKRRLEESGHKALVEMETRKFGKRTVPWFEALTAISEHGDSGDLGETVTVWAMEYQPSYFELPEAAKEPSEGPHDTISRERYQSDAYATRMVRDVVHVHFELGADDFARIEPLFGAAGYRITRSPGEVLAEGRESSLRFSLSPTDAQRLRQVRFALNAPAKRQVETIGRSKLEIGPDATAIWTFQ